MCSIMRSQKSLLSRARSDSGSAVSDFVLLVVPASLLCLPLIEIFGVYQGAIVKEQVSFEIARFAALADVSLDQALANKQAQDPLAQMDITSSSTSCFFVVRTQIEKKSTLWPEVVQVPISGSATCEH